MSASPRNPALRRNAPNRPGADANAIQKSASAVIAATKRATHGTDYHTLFAQLWEEQAGKCYLCGEPLPPGRHTHIDHDHSCCPKGKTCSYCRRGLACSRCNHLIGHAGDDPELMRRVADNFEPVNIRTKARLASRPAQGILWEEAS